MKDNFDIMIIEIANYICDNECTIRECAKVYSKSKSSIHGYMHNKLKDIDFDLYQKVQKVLDYNFSVRHLRGGESTKKRYKNTKKPRKKYMDILCIQKSEQLSDMDT